MAKRTFQLNAEQSSELWQAYYDARQVQEQRRLQAVRLYGEGWTVSAIQQASGCSAPSLMRWVADYRWAGVAATGRQPRALERGTTRLYPSENAALSSRSTGGEPGTSA